jgi:RNA polymerase sigma factor for flagellar operon FliA
VRQA